MLLKTFFCRKTPHSLVPLSNLQTRWTHINRMHNISYDFWFGPARNNKNQPVLFTKNIGKQIGTPSGTLFVHLFSKTFSKPWREISIVFLKPWKEISIVVFFKTSGRNFHRSFQNLWKKFHCAFFQTKTFGRDCCNLPKNYKTFSKKKCFLKPFLWNRSFWRLATIFSKTFPKENPHFCACIYEVVKLWIKWLNPSILLLLCHHNHRNTLHKHKLHEHPPLQWM